MLGTSWPSSSSALPIPVPKVSRMTTPPTPLAAPNRASAMPAASASLSTVTSQWVMSVKTLSTSVPIQLLSTFAALLATPFLMTAGNVAPSSPVHSASLTSRATTSATASGVDGLGVRYFTRSVARSPLSRSTMAPLIPLPPMSTPNAVDDFLLGTWSLPSPPATYCLDHAPSRTALTTRSDAHCSCWRSPSSSPAAPAP